MISTLDTENLKGASSSLGLGRKIFESLMDSIESTGRPRLQLGSLGIAGALGGGMLWDRLGLAVSDIDALRGLEPGVEEDLDFTCRVLGAIRAHYEEHGRFRLDVNPLGYAGHGMGVAQFSERLASVSDTIVGLESQCNDALSHELPF